MKAVDLSAILAVFDIVVRNIVNAYLPIVNCLLSLKI